MKAHYIYKLKYILHNVFTKSLHSEKQLYENRYVCVCVMCQHMTIKKSNDSLFYQ